MRIEIRFRRDDCTDNVVIEVETWEEVFNEVKSIETINTVLTIERMEDEEEDEEVPEFLDENAQILLDALSNTTLEGDGRPMYEHRCRAVSDWVEHGRITPEMREKMLKVLIEKELLLRTFCKKVE